MMKRKIKLRIFATIESGEGKDADTDTIKIECEGSLTEENGRVTICYEELLLENERSACALSYELAEPNVVTLVREGATSSVMSFSERARYSGKYDLGFATMDFIVSTRRVINRINTERGGTLLLDYSTEVQGVILQSAKFRFEITCLENME